MSDCSAEAVNHSSCDDDKSCRKTKQLRGFINEYCPTWASFDLCIVWETQTLQTLACQMYLNMDQVS